MGPLVIVRDELLAMEGFLIGERVTHFLSRFLDDGGEASQHTDRGLASASVGGSGQVRTEDPFPGSEEYEAMPQPCLTLWGE